MNTNTCRCVTVAVVTLFTLLHTAVADITTAKITTRAEATKDGDNRISVKTGDQEEIATVNLSQNATPEERNRDRAGAINSQMTRVTAEASSGVGAHIITLTALDGRKITGVDHNGLNGEEINVNPQSLLYTNTKLTCVEGGVAKDDALCSMDFPQLGVFAAVHVVEGMPGEVVMQMLFQQLVSQGMTGVFFGNGFELAPVPVGGKHEDPFRVGSNFRYTGLGLGMHVEYFWPAEVCTGSADFDGDGFLTGIDFDLFVMAFEAGIDAADYDRDGFTTGIDFDLFVADFEAGCV